MKTIVHFKHVNTFRDRYGKPRHYFRRPGQKAILLPGEPGSPEFVEAYHAAMNNMPRREVGKDRSRAGTVDATLKAYYASQTWQSMAKGTQRNHRTALERFRQLPDVGEGPINRLTRKHVTDVLDRMPPIPGRHWLVAVRALMQYAVKKELRSDDPTEGVKRIKPPASNGWRTWTDAEISQYEAYWPIGSMPRLCFALALYTGQRRSDVLEMGPQHIKDGWMIITPTKTRRTTAKTLRIKIDARLQHVIDNTPQSGHLVYIVAQQGKPYANGDTFSEAFKGWCRKARLPNDLSLHGLRKAFCRIAVEEGASESEVRSYTGHTTSRQLQPYIQARDEAILAERLMDRKAIRTIK
jgi:integrase